MNMKKISAVILALVMVLSLTATAFAVELEDSAITNGKTHDVTGSYDPSTSGATYKDAYKVNITWNAMTFTFKDNATSGEYVWSPDDLKFILKNDTTAADGTWESSDNTFTLENRSSKAVGVKAAVTAEAVAAGITAAVKIDTTDILTSTYTLGSAVGYTGKGPEATGTVTLSGTPDMTTKINAGTKLFGLTLTLTHD